MPVYFASRDDADHNKEENFQSFDLLDKINERPTAKEIAQRKH